MKDKVLYLSERDVEAVGLGVAEIHAAVEAVFVAKSAGRTLTKPKVSLSPEPGDAVQALIGVSGADAVTGCKWVNAKLRNADAGLPGIHATLLLNDLNNGRPRAIINAAWITGVRTAACTAVAARYLASPDSATIGFIGCGLQARTHAEALCFVRPTLDTALCFSRTQASAQRFAAHCTASGLHGTVCRSPRDVVAQSDIVVTTVPASAGLQPFLDAAWLKPSAFVGAVDLGRSWCQHSWHGAFQVIATDDCGQSMQRGAEGLMLVPDRFDVELGALPGRPKASCGRSAVLFSGIAIADIAVGLALEAKARKLGIGTCLDI